MESYSDLDLELNNINISNVIFEILKMKSLPVKTEEKGS